MSAMLGGQAKFLVTGVGVKTALARRCACVDLDVFVGEHFCRLLILIGAVYGRVLKALYHLMVHK